MVHDSSAGDTAAGLTWQLEQISVSVRHGLARLAFEIVPDGTDGPHVTPEVHLDLNDVWQAGVALVLAEAEQVGLDLVAEDGAGELVLLGSAWSSFPPTFARSIAEAATRTLEQLAPAGLNSDELDSWVSETLSNYEGPRPARRANPTAAARLLRVADSGWSELPGDDEFTERAAGPRPGPDGLLQCDRPDPVGVVGDPQPEDRTTEDDLVADQKHPVSVQIAAVPVLSYAMAHNRVPLVHRLELHNGGVGVQAARVTVEVRDAEGVVTAPCERLVDLEPGGSTTLSEIGLVADPAAMLQVEEQRPATLTVRVHAGEDLLGEESTPVRLLAARQWLRVPPVLSLELLAAFVVPNDPAIAAFMADVADVLERRTGSPSLEGYQSDPDRVDAIAAAVFEAAQARRIRYSEPPASWADRGQKVRTPAEVLEGRVGTCLDTVVVLAAALEQAGIRPLLWVTKGHAFLGYWRQEMALDAIAQTDVSDVVNYIDLGLIRLVETTLVTAREEPARFEDAHRPPYATYLTGDLDEVLGVTDVWTARQNDVVPLPARHRATDGAVQVVEYRPAQHSAPPRPNAPTTQQRTARAGTNGAVPARVQQWKNALLDLSLRNKLINYSDRSGVQLTVPDGHLGQVEDMVIERQALTLLPADHLDDVHVARGVRSGADLPQAQLADALLRQKALFTSVASAGYTTRLRGLAYKARTIAEETGANNLYLALGSLVWSLEGKPLRSPLVLVPVTLVSRARSTTYRLELDESGASTPNYCLLEKLRQVHGLDVPGLAKPEEDGAGIDLDAALQAMRLAVAEWGLPYRVEPTADLAILQFAKFRLWKDLDEHWPALVANPLVRHLVESPNHPFTDAVGEPERPVALDELDALCPVPADASQLAAVADAVAGRTFVLEGPPGTGKSQTITNLLTRAVADGKRVLFVAEKRAALDVVRQRLDAVGMGPFSLDLHDKASKPAVVRAQVKQALDHAVGVDEQGLAAQQEDLRAARRTLARYAQRLHEPNPAGLSYYSARTGLLALGEDAEALPVPTELVSGTATAALEPVRRAMASLPDTADLARPAVDHPWGFVEGTDPDRLDVEAMRAAVAAADAALLAVPPVSGGLAEALAAARTPMDVAALAALVDSPVPLPVLDQTRSRAWQEASTALGHEIGAFVAAAHPGLDVATPAALDLPLADLHAQAQAAAASGFFGRKKRLRAVLAQLEPALRPDATVPPKRVPELTGALLQVQGAVHALASRATGVPGVRVPAGWNPLTEEGQRLVEHQVGWLSWAGGAVEDPDTEVPRAAFTVALRRFLDAGAHAEPAVQRALRDLADTLRAVSERSGTSAGTWTRWSGAVGLVQRWRMTVAGRALGDPQLLGLRRWVAFLGALEPLRAAGLHEARELLITGAVHADDAVRALDRGIAVASLAERRDATGLAAFDAAAHDRAVGRFTTATRAVRGHLVTAVPEQVLRARPFQPDTGRGRVGALQRELAKQRRGLGIRTLLATYGDLITQVMPCVLVSPDSVARFFPVGGELFDLVVFDEASQIRVADAVGAMGRSTSVVVVGDSKQMPPTSFAESSSGDDDEAVAEEQLAVEDQESILSESVQARVPRRWLSWHYRSTDESLIAFSNQHYYEGRLSSFPAPRLGDADPGVTGHGISLVRVDGQFHRSGRGKLLRTNPKEAEALVAEIRRRFDASPDTVPSLGVVTFNQQQRAFIEGLLRDSGDERLVEALDSAEEGLFVKNLENVQGDERDVILFSTGFSVNDKGVLPLNFGPLNRGGGERRLNVAVTRARRQVVVFSSFDPAQLRAEETASVGIKHLRAYLDLAASGTSVLQAGGACRPTGDRHREEVASGLRERGHAVQVDVGLSEFTVDLAVADAASPEQPVLAVLLDGPGWAERRTVGDRDGLPAEVLSRLMGWPAVERVWLPAWLADREWVLDRLGRAVREASRSGGGSSKPAGVNLPPAPAVPAGTPAPIPVDLPRPRREELPEVALLRSSPGTLSQPEPLTESVLLGEEPFVAWNARLRGSREVLDRLPSPAAAREVRAALEDAVQAEGPVHLDRLAKLVAGAFDLSRVNQARATAILRHLPRELQPADGESFAWPAHRRPGEWAGFRRAPESDPRPIEHVSLVELGNAMVALCAASAGMEREELLRETLAVFGGRRLTPGISRRLEEALTAAVHRGRLSHLAGMYNTA